MYVAIIYIIITGLGVGTYLIVFQPILKANISLMSIHNMLHLELVNDLFNSRTGVNKQSIDNRSLAFPLQKSLLHLQLNAPSIYEGTAFILFIEQWLLKDALSRNANFQFYADRELYSQTIPAKIKYEACQWIEVFLKTKPNYIEFKLSSHSNTVQLKVKKVIKNSVVLDLNTYLSTLESDDLPGKLKLFQKEYLMIEFKMK